MFSARSLDNYDPNIVTGQQRIQEKNIITSLNNISDDNEDQLEFLKEKVKKVMPKHMKTRGKQSSLSQKIQKDKRDYVKISNQQKAQLIYKVFHQNRKINEVTTIKKVKYLLKAAKECNLKYASAKTIVFAYRNQKSSKQNKNKYNYKTAGLKNIRQEPNSFNTYPCFQIICLIGGKSIISSTQPSLMTTPKVPILTKVSMA